MLQTQRDGNQLIFCPQVDIVSPNVSEMRNRLLEEIEKDDSWQTLILDCHKIEKLDSIGVNLMVAILKKVQVYRKQMKVTHCEKSIARVLHLFRLDQQFVVEGRNAE